MSYLITRTSLQLCGSFYGNVTFYVLNLTSILGFQFYCHLSLRLHDGQFHLFQGIYQYLVQRYIYVLRNTPVLMNSDAPACLNTHTPFLLFWFSYYVDPYIYNYKINRDFLNVLSGTLFRKFDKFFCFLAEFSFCSIQTNNLLSRIFYLLIHRYEILYHKRNIFLSRFSLC